MVVRLLEVADFVFRRSSFNHGETFGAGYFQVTQDDGVSQNAYTAFLKPTLANSNGRDKVDMRVGQAVQRILFNGTQAVGVLMRDETHGHHSIIHTKNVIVSAGAIGSPALLQRSGVGPRQLLADLGIPLVYDAAGVGSNLQDHVSFTLKFTCNNNTFLERFYKALAASQSSKLRTNPGNIGRNFQTVTGVLSVILRHPVLTGLCVV